eukprot:838835-Pyramimonas_sp.AAC.1
MFVRVCEWKPSRKLHGNTMCALSGMTLTTSTRCGALAEMFPSGACEDDCKASLIALSEITGLPRPGGVTLVERADDIVPVRNWVNLVLHHTSLTRPAWKLLTRRQLR